MILLRSTNNYKKIAADLCKKKGFVTHANILIDLYNSNCLALEGCLLDPDGYRLMPIMDFESRLKAACKLGGSHETHEIRQRISIMLRDGYIIKHLRDPDNSSNSAWFYFAFKPGARL